MKKALITGITGQDGSYLAEFLLEKGYDVHGVIRRSSVDYRERIAHLEGHPHFHLHYGDLSDSMSILSVVSTVRPDEIYNLAAQSHVQVSFDVPEFTADVDATGVLRVLEAVRLSGLKDTCRIYQASTSELYGKVEEVPQNENTPFHPYSPYAVAKQYGFWIVKEYREAYNMFCCSGILFNHESERRGETFVTRKITLAAARIAQGKQDKLYLGNLSSLRDWGYARDYVECMWLILQNDKPEDFVIATGVAALRPRVLPAGLPRCGHRAGICRRGHEREGHRQGHGQDGHRGQPRLLPPDRRRQPLGRPVQSKDASWAGTRPRLRLSSSSRSWSTTT